MLGDETFSTSRVAVQQVGQLLPLWLRSAAPQVQGGREAGWKESFRFTSLTDSAWLVLRLRGETTDGDALGEVRLASPLT